MLLFGVVSRLTWQKGLDLLLDALPALLATGAQLACSAPASGRWRRRLPPPPQAYPGRVGCVIGYDEALAHLMQAGADALLVPSRFEPCGLTQLCALRYGALPVVARVGGLADTVMDANEMAVARASAPACSSPPVTPTMLDAALRRTARLWREPWSVAAAATQRHAHRRVLAAARRALCRALPRNDRLTRAGRMIAGLPRNRSA